MSELTICNCCSLKGIRRRAKEAGKRVYVMRNVRWTSGGVNVYVLPSDVYVPIQGIVEDSEFHKKYFTAWFMEVSQSCAC